MSNTKSSPRPIVMQARYHGGGGAVAVAAPMVSCGRCPTGGRPCAKALRILGVLGVVAPPPRCWRGAGEAQAPRKGGVLRVGMIGEPPTLDGHATTAVITREIAINMFEGLYALDAKYQPVPLLAEGHEVARRRQALRDPAAQGREVPQRQGAHLGRRGGLAEALGRHRPAPARRSSRTSRRSRPRARTRSRSGSRSPRAAC